MINAGNDLINLLSDRPRRLLLSGCERTELQLSQVVSRPGEVTRYAYFPIDGCISLIAGVENYPGVEVGMIGREGMMGAELALGVATSPLHGIVQGSGSAWRIGAATLRGHLAANPVMQRMMLRYVHVLMSQAANSSACLRFHLIEPRLARWLLMMRDRAQSDRFRVTQAFLAYMLGVRRVGVTVAAGALAQSGLIEYQRGWLIVLDRAGLEAASCTCYRADCGLYRSVFPSAEVSPA